MWPTLTYYLHVLALECPASTHSYSFFPYTYTHTHTVMHRSKSHDSVGVSCIYLSWSTTRYPPQKNSPRRLLSEVHISFLVWTTAHCGCAWRYVCRSKTPHVPTHKLSIFTCTIFRYVMMRDKIELDSIPGMVFCPRCKSRTLSDPSSKVAVCDNLDCGFPFCKVCQLTWHGPGKCPALDKVRSYSLWSILPRDQLTSA